MFKPFVILSRAEAIRSGYSKGAPEGYGGASGCLGVWQLRADRLAFDTRRGRRSFLLPWP
jgi:hypothetical protein